MEPLFRVPAGENKEIRGNEFHTSLMRDIPVWIAVASPRDTALASGQAGRDLLFRGCAR